MEIALNPGEDQAEAFFLLSDGSPETAGQDQRRQNPLALKEGYIVFWFKPLRWDGHSFVYLMRGFDGASERRKELFRIYLFPHHWVGFSVLRFFPDGKRGNLFCNRMYVDHWLSQPHQWRLFAVTWKNGKAKLYVDGLEVSSDQDFKREFVLGDLLQFGRESYRYDKNRKRTLTGNKTLVDEFRIYDTALRPDEILRMYEHFMGPLIEFDDF